MNHECHEKPICLTIESLYNKSLYTVRDYVWPLCNDISQLKNILEKYSNALRAM